MSHFVSLDQPTLAPLPDPQYRVRGNDASLRALVVDDEPVARRTVIFALSREGFQCDAAVDGLDALEKLSKAQYDVVVTDLLMPHKHGHALTVQLLEERRDGFPLIVVHTSVDNPRLTKDLIMRGVDDIIYKPTHYEAFAAKMRAMVKRRRLGQEHRAVYDDSPTRMISSETPSTAAPAASTKRVSQEEFDQQIQNVHHLLPVSEIALEVLHRVRADDCDARCLADLIKKDAVLTTELLKLVNNGFYNPSGRKITELHEAIARVGVRRIGEISLAVTTFKALARLSLPWLDMQLIHGRSLAGCLLADRLLPSSVDPQMGRAVTFSALVFPLSRAVTAGTFPQLYKQMLETGDKVDCSLDEQEAELLPVAPRDALLRLLAQWGLPADLYAPLIHLDSTPQALTELPPALAEAVRTLRTVLALAPLATGIWMPWETVDIPPHLGLTSGDAQQLATLVRQVRSELKNQLGNSHAPRHGTSPPRRAKLPYARFAPASPDWLREILQSAEFELVDAPGTVASLPNGAVVNALDAQPDEVAMLCDLAPGRHLLVLLRKERGSIPSGKNFLGLPTSFRNLVLRCTAHVTD